MTFENMPLMPLREDHAMAQFLNDTYPVNRDFVSLLKLAVGFAQAALEHKNPVYRSGWLFGRPSFIRAIRAIRDINADGTVYTYGASWSETWKTLWGKLRELIAAHARINNVMILHSISASAISEKYDKPLDTDALKCLFDYCRYAAQRIYPNDKATIGLYYDTGVFNIPLENYKGVQRLETGMQQAQREHKEIMTGVRQNGEKLDVILDWMRSRPSSYAVSQGDFCKLLSVAECPRNVRTIQRWEAYLETNGKEGTNPPDGYTLKTRETLAGANAWVQTFAALEKAKLKTKVGFDDRRHKRT